MSEFRHFPVRHFPVLQIQLSRARKTSKSLAWIAVVDTNYCCRDSLGCTLRGLLIRSGVVRRVRRALGALAALPATFTSTPWYCYLVYIERQLYPDLHLIVPITDCGTHYTHTTVITIAAAIFLLPV